MVSSVQGPDAIRPVWSPRAPRARSRTRQPTRGRATASRRGWRRGTPERRGRGARPRRPALRPDEADRPHVEHQRQEGAGRTELGPALQREIVREPNRRRLLVAKRRRAERQRPRARERAVLRGVDRGTPKPGPAVGKAGDRLGLWTRVRRGRRGDQTAREGHRDGKDRERAGGSRPRGGQAKRSSLEQPEPARAGDDCREPDQPWSVAPGHVRRDVAPRDRIGDAPGGRREHRRGKDRASPRADESRAEHARGDHAERDRELTREPARARIDPATAAPPAASAATRGSRARAMAHQRTGSADTCISARAGEYSSGPPGLHCPPSLCARGSTLAPAP